MLGFDHLIVVFVHVSNNVVKIRLVYFGFPIVVSLIDNNSLNRSKVKFSVFKKLFASV